MAMPAPAIGKLTEIITLINKPTGSGQIYLKDILTGAFNIFMSKDVGFRYGVIDEPIHTNAAYAKNASHYLMDVWDDGARFMGEIQVVDTPMGRILQDLLESGVDITLGLAAVASFARAPVVSLDFFEEHEDEEYSKIVDDMAVVMVYAVAKASTNH